MDQKSLGIEGAWTNPGKSDGNGEVKKPRQFYDDRVFLSRQARERDALERYPILYLAGYGAPSFHGRYFISRLEVEGFDVYEVKLPRFQTGDIPHSAAVLSIEVQKARRRFGASKVNLVGHSLGGVISRYYLQKLGGWKNVHRAVYLGTPHRGVRAAALIPFTKAGRQLMPNSNFMRDLNSDPARCRNIKCLSIISRFDEVVVPREAGILPCGYNKVVSWPMGHWGVVFSNKVIGWIVDFFDGLFDIRENSVCLIEERISSDHEGCEPSVQEPA